MQHRPGGLNFLFFYHRQNRGSACHQRPLSPSLNNPTYAAVHMDVVCHRKTKTDSFGSGQAVKKVLRWFEPFTSSCFSHESLYCSWGLRVMWSVCLSAESNRVRRAQVRARTPKLSPKLSSSPQKTKILFIICLSLLFFSLKQTALCRSEIPVTIWVAKWCGN